jgi:integrase
MPEGARSFSRAGRGAAICTDNAGGILQSTPIGAQRSAESRVRLRRFTRQDLLGHASVETTQLYTHVMQQPGLGVRSPLDA